MNPRESLACLRAATVSEKVCPFTVTYDALGNAIASQDVGGKFSYKVYDQAGRVLWDIDAKGQVTGYVHDGFGATKQLTRYAQAMDIGTVGTAGLSNSAVTAHLDRVSHVADRTLTTQYDALGRAVKVIEPISYVYDQHRLPGNAGMESARATDTVYNAFGDVLRSSVYGQDAQGQRTTVAADTYSSYNILGQKAAELVVFERSAGEPTARAYLSTMAYDAVGNLKEQTEYANAVTVRDSDWSAKTGMAYSGPSSNPDQDRKVQYGWDLNNRQTSQTRLNVVSGENRARTNQTTSFGS